MLLGVQSNARAPNQGVGVSRGGGARNGPAYGDGGDETKGRRLCDRSIGKYTARSVD